MPRYDPHNLVTAEFRRGGRNNPVASRNERDVLSEIWHRSLPSRAEIVGRLDLTQQSVHRIIEQLEARGLIYLGEMKPAVGRGQPSPVLHLRKDWCFTIGISVNTDRAGVALMHLDGTHKIRFLKIEGLSMERALEQIETCIDEMIAAEGRSRDRLLGVGFCIAGFSVSGTQYNAPLPLHEWSLIELGPLLSQRFQAPVWTENIANAAALAELMFGIGHHVKNFSYLSFNYGLGGAIVVDGKLLRGGHGNAGEVSNMLGPVEHYQRPTLSSLLEELRSRDVPVSSIWALQGKFDLAWPGVAEWLERVAPAYQQILNAVFAIADPEAIVFGGVIPGPLAEELIARAEFFRYPRYGISPAEPKLVVSKLREPASLGAAAMPLTALLL